MPSEPERLTQAHLTALATDYSTRKEFEKLYDQNRDEAIRLFVEFKVDEWYNDGVEEIVRCLTLFHCDKDRQPYAAMSRDDFLSLVEESFYFRDDETTDEIVQRLLALAVKLKVPEDALDDAVHAAAQETALDELNAIEDNEAQLAHIDTQAAEASAVNNNGLEGQIRYLLGDNTTEACQNQVEGLLRDSVKES